MNHKSLTGKQTLCFELSRVRSFLDLGMSLVEMLEAMPASYYKRCWQLWGMKRLSQECSHSCLM